METFDKKQDISRTDPCPCGSGKKYKDCCGAQASAPSGRPDVPAIGAPTLEQWRALYEVAMNIKLLEPWKYLWDSDLITLLLPGRDEPVWCSVMGNNGECFAVGVYPGYDSIRGYFQIRDMCETEPPFISMGLQDCILCYFGDREELSPNERKTLKELGLTFRGRNQWIYFRSMKPGFFPWFIDADQAELMIQALQNFVMALMRYLDGTLKVDFEAGETLLRYYSEEDGNWFSGVSPMLPIPEDNRMLVITDEMLIARLNAKRQTEKQIELDLFYMPFPTQENRKDIPRFPRIALLADIASGIVVDQHMAYNEDASEDVIIDMLVAYMISQGRPSRVFVRDGGIGRYIADLCNKTSVDLVMSEGVPVIDEIAKSLLGFMEDRD